MARPGAAVDAARGTARPVRAEASSGRSIADRAPSEFRLLLACCRWPRVPALIAAAATVSIDWPLFARMARRHRVEALAWRALEASGTSVPQSAAQPLAAASARTAAENLAIAAETARLVHALREAGIPHLFVKGLALGALAYGTILIKAGWDIDLLVPAESLQPATELLAREGYALLVPAGAATPSRIAAWHGRSKESVWHNRARSSHIELHTALADHPMLLPGLGVESPRQIVEIAPGLTVPTLATDELFAYLVVHGASSAWFRLKWLADLAALLASQDAAEVERLYRRSQRLGAGRAAGLALLLCADLFETPAPEPLIEELRADRVTRWLLAASWHSLAGRSVATELGALRAGTLWIHLTQFGLERGLAFKWRELRRQLRMLGPFAAARL